MTDPLERQREIFERDQEEEPCPYDPKVLKGKPIGMFHCPECGEMQIAGMDHLPPQEEDQG